MTRDDPQRPTPSPDDLPSDPPPAGTPVWLYARSATSPTAIDDQHHQLATTAAAHGLVVAGRSSDLGRDPHTPDRRPGWDAAVTAVTSGAVTDVVVYHRDRLDRHPGAFAHRVNAIDDAGGRLWVTDPPDTLRPVDANPPPPLGAEGSGQPRARRR